MIRSIGTFWGAWMANSLRTISTAEAAFLADLPQRKINQVVDDKILPSRLYETSPRARRFVPMAAALAKFYFGTESVMAAHARKEILQELVQRVQAMPNHEAVRVLSLSSLGHDSTWRVQPLEYIDVNVAGFVQIVMARLHTLEEINDHIESNPDVMQGAAVFKGTRVPVHLVVQFLRQGETVDVLQADYPFLTPKLIELGRLYEALNPRRGRPRSLVTHYQDWQEVQNKVRAAHA